MAILIRGGRILDPSVGRDEIGDLYIADGVIKAVPKTLSEDTEIIDAEGKWVVPGLVDLHVHLRDPGLTYKETIKTGSEAAAAGGFTTICAMPNTKPVTDTPETVSYVKKEGNNVGKTNVLPIGAITRGQQGKELTDQKALKAAGVCALSEDGRSVADAELMKKAMEEARLLKLIILDHCEEESLAKAGDSRSAENVMTKREIELSQKTDCPLHICHVSTKESAELVRRARAQGLKITAEVCPHHFVLDDSFLALEDPNYKMNPPLRTKEDIEAMKKALKEGVITCIATDHAPHAEEEKQVPYEKAANGIVGLETAFSLSRTYLVPEVLSPLQLIACMSTNPAGVLGIDKGTLQVGRTADVTIIDPNRQWQIDKSKFFTKGRNCPFEKMNVQGKVMMTILGGCPVFSEKMNSK